MAVDIKQAASELIQSGKAMSTAKILIVLGKASLQLGKNVSDSDKHLRRMIGLNAKTARLHIASKQLASKISATANAIEQHLGDLGKSQTTLGLQQNYIQKFAPLKAEVIERNHERDGLLKAIKHFTHEQQTKVADIVNKAKSPAETKSLLEELEKKQRDIALAETRLNTNEQSLQKKLDTLKKETHHAAINARNTSISAPGRPELE